MTTACARPKELPTSYQVHLTVFEGPINLLLQLIERRELSITQISLALIADQYLQYIQGMTVIEPGEVVEFLTIAAQLMLIKSRLLLPSPVSASSEEEDAGQSLVQQLEAYRRYKAAAQRLRLREERGQRTFVRTAPVDVPSPPLPQGVGVPVQLLTAIEGVLALQSATPLVSELVSPITVTITEQMALIRERVQGENRCYFHHLLTSSSSRMVVIVTFLALLELVLRREVTVQQNGVFGEILISELSPPVVTPSSPSA